MNEPLENASPDVLLGLIQQLVAEYAERTERDETFDMQPIERGIAAFCGQLNAMPKTESSRYEPALESLMKDLTRLGQLMQSKQQELMVSLRDTNTIKKANKAYQNSDSFALPDGLKKVTKDIQTPEE
jgi:hypothetical protein